jgi:hypothetical protein
MKIIGNTILGVNKPFEKRKLLFSVILTEKEVDEILTTLEELSLEIEVPDEAEVLYKALNKIYEEEKND